MTSEHITLKFQELFNIDFIFPFHTYWNLIIWWIVLNPCTLAKFYNAVLFKVSICYSFYTRITTKVFWGKYAIQKLPFKLQISYTEQPINGRKMFLLHIPMRSTTQKEIPPHFNCSYKITYMYERLWVVDPKYRSVHYFRTFSKYVMCIYSST